MGHQVIVKKSKLEGEVSISGAKNNSLKLLAASLLTSANVELSNTPNNILDFSTHLDMLKVLGKTIDETSGGGVLIKEPEKPQNFLKWEERSIRNTLLILGCLLTRTNYGKVPLPGGCKLGERKYDIHVDIMEKMGASVWDEGDYLCAESKNRLKGCDIFLPIRSTGATENAILMGCLAEGKTKIWNPHIRPEIIDLILMLNKMGAEIVVNGQESIEVIGKEELGNVAHECIPDNMEALTFAMGTAISGGEVEIHNFPLEHLELPMIYLRESGMRFFISENNKSIIVKAGNIYPFEIATGPYPSINSDMQPLFAAYGLFAQGESRIVDLRFAGRYQYAMEFNKLGADTKVDGDILKIFGGNNLTGATTTATDLRAGAALTIAGLGIEGETLIQNYEQVFRGYNNFLENLKNLGADVNQV